MLRGGVKPEHMVIAWECLRQIVYDKISEQRFSDDYLKSVSKIIALGTLIMIKSYYEGLLKGLTISLEIGDKLIERSASLGAKHLLVDTRDEITLVLMCIRYEFIEKFP